MDTNIIPDNIKKLPLYVLTNKESDDYGWSTLYIIDELIKGKWVRKERGKIDESRYDLPEDQINSVYSKYKGKENFRLALYGSSLSHFPDVLRENRIISKQGEIKLLQESIDIILAKGFQFQRESDFIYSQSTGLVLIKILDEDSDIFHWCHKFFDERSIQEWDTDFSSDIVERIFLHNLYLIQARLQHEEKILLNNTDIFGVMSSLWHKTKENPRRQDKMQYLLEFDGSDFNYTKWKLIKIDSEYTVFKPNSDQLFIQQFSDIKFEQPTEETENRNYKIEPIPINFYTLYLENGDNKMLGIPLNNVFRDSKIDSCTEFHYTRFWESIVDLLIEPRSVKIQNSIGNLLTSLGDLGFEYSTTEIFSNLMEQLEKYPGTIPKVLNCLYDNPYSKEISTELPDLIKNLNDTNSIWDCISE